jgi:hypothetical protein
MPRALQWMTPHRSASPGNRALISLRVQRPFWVENQPENSCRKSKSGLWTSREFSGERNRNFLFECARWSQKQLPVQRLDNVRPCLTLATLAVQVAMIANSIWGLPLRNISTLVTAFT